MRGKPLQQWTALDHLLRSIPDEYCPIPAPGARESDRTYMRQAAERIVRSPRLTRDQRSTIERGWLAAVAS